jgi:NitT/TauT family transport system ATP-binding protein
LFDEPFSAPDEMTARALRSEFTRLVRQNGKTAVFVTHSIDEAMQVGDRLLVFHRPARIALEAEIAGDLTAAAQERLRQRILEVMSAGSDVAGSKDETNLSDTASSVPP